MTHDDVREDLGLLPGATWTYRFVATVTEDEDGLTKETRTDGGYQEKVVDVSVNGPYTVVTVMRTILKSEDDRAGWNIQRKPGPIYYLIGGKGRIHRTVPPDTSGYANTEEGLAVFVQRGKLNVQNARRSWMAYAMPLTPGAMWHAHPNARELAAAQLTTVGIRTVPTNAGAVEVPAGKYDRCTAVETPGMRTTTTVWTCAGTGMVKRLTERRTGSPRFVIHETLQKFTPAQ